jgi:amino acid transporter
MGFLEIVSKTLTLVPLKITFLELTIYIASVVVFCLSLMLIAKTFYKAKIKREVLPELKA